MRAASFSGAFTRLLRAAYGTNFQWSENGTTLSISATFALSFLEGILNPTTRPKPARRASGPVR
jgi:hypothetical protein